MLKADQVPNESILAVVARFPALFSNHDEVEAVIADAINAWPGMCIRTRMTYNFKTGEWNIPEKLLSLPLPQDQSND